MKLITSDQFESMNYLFHQLKASFNPRWDSGTTQLWLCSIGYYWLHIETLHWKCGGLQENPKGANRLCIEKKPKTIIMHLQQREENGSTKNSTMLRSVLLEEYFYTFHEIVNSSSWLMITNFKKENLRLLVFSMHVTRVMSSQNLGSVFLWIV